MLPEIIGCGFFDSSKRFKGGGLTSKRRVFAYEIELFAEDDGIAYLDDNEYEIKKDMLLFAKPGQMRNSLLHFKCYYLKIILDEGSLSDYFNKISPFTAISDSSKYINIFRSIIAVFNSDFEGREFKLYAGIMELLYLIYRNSKLNILNESMKNIIHSDILKNSAEYINKNYSNKISLDDIAKSVNLSPTYFHQIFTKGIGITPHRFLLNCRIRNAKKMLLAEPLSFLEIALQCGFSSQSYFNYIFKKETGQTPKQFRDGGDLY